MVLISIIAPCHHIIGASGNLTGFTGGLKNKAMLLRPENNQANFKSGQVGIALTNKKMQVDIFE